VDTTFGRGRQRSSNGSDDSNPTAKEKNKKKSFREVSSSDAFTKTRGKATKKGG